MVKKKRDIWADEKPFYKSKGKMGAILMALGAVGSYLSGVMDLAMAVTTISGALGLYGVRDAMKQK